MSYRILQLRKQYHLSQQSLAQKISTSQKSIDNWEKGVTEPSAGVLIRLADFFGCSVDYLLGRESDVCSAPSAPTDLDPNGAALLNYYKLCKEPQKKSLLTYARFLTNDLS